MSIHLPNHTYQYPMEVAENMLVQVGKFDFTVDFIILQMEEDDRVPLILGRPFLHTVDAIIRVKNKELNLGIGEDKATFHIDKAMQHSYVNDNTSFRMDVIDEITEDELDALLDDSKPFLNKSEKISETPLDKEFNKFIKGAENVTADHLSRLEKPNLKELKDEEINDEFPDEFLITYKTLISTTPYLLLYGKMCHLPFQIEHRAYWALRSCNPDLKIAGEKQFLQLHELDELRLQAYENSKLYKARTKAYHDNKLRVRKEFKAGDKVLMCNSKYKFKAPKLRSNWYGPFIVKHGYLSGYVELYDKHGGSFIVNGHHVKLYQDEEQLNELTIEEIHLMSEDRRMKAIPFMAPFLANYRETMQWESEKSYIYSVVENTCNEAKLYDLDETGKGIVIENVLYVPSEGSSLEKK
ncbi:reverse transcriptase domain-containing protein [Tanacetum coccineum]